jgi:hypothetical protein
MFFYKPPPPPPPRQKLQTYLQIVPIHTWAQSGLRGLNNKGSFVELQYTFYNEYL